MTVVTIIVNYNAGAVLQRCVNAVLKSEEQTTITVIDNASSDGSAKELHQSSAGNKLVEVLFNPTNMGFAAAINTVARRLDCNWILVLNPDCILESSTLGKLKSALVNDPRAGLAAPTVRDENGRIQRATLRHFPDPWRSFVTSTGLWRLGRWLPVFHGVEIDAATLTSGTVVCDAVSGACMLLRRSALESVGFLDDQYAMHCEDLDLMRRLKDNGWHCLYVSQANSIHHQGLSSRSRPLWVHFQKHRGMARFFGKFQARTVVFPMRMLVYTGIWLRFLVTWPLVLIKH